MDAAASSMTWMNALYGESLLRGAAGLSDHRIFVGAFAAIAFLGSASFFAVAMPVLFAWAPMRWAIRMAIAFSTSAALSEWVKAAVDRPRLDPAAFGVVAALEHAGAYESAAFPSGHTLMAVVLWGTLALHLKSIGARIACVLLIALIATSRLALLRHDLLDVAGGLALGSLLLAALFFAERSWGRSLAQLPRIERAGLFIVCAVATQAIVALESTAVVTGVGAGLGAGALLAASRRRRTRRCGVAAGIVRTIAMVAGVALARMLVEPGDGATMITLFGVYFGAALWVSAVVPLLFGGVYERAEA